MKATNELQELFAELVTITIGAEKVSKNILNNTVKFWQEKAPFNLFPIEYWFCVINAKTNIKIKL